MGGCRSGWADSVKWKVAIHCAPARCVVTGALLCYGLAALTGMSLFGDEDRPEGEIMPRAGS